MIGFQYSKTLYMETQKGFDPQNYYLKMGQYAKILTAKLLLTAKQLKYFICIVIVIRKGGERL
jgi:hypothetical protein